MLFRRLSDVWDARGDQYTYARDRRDRVDTLYYPNGVTESRVYDDDDRLTNRGGGLMALSLTVSY